MNKIIIFLFSLWAPIYCVCQPIAGIKTIKKSGGDYSTFAAAINDLNTNGVGMGGVTFNVDAGFIDTNSNMAITTTTSSASNPIIFQKTGTGANPLIVAGTGTGTMDGIIKIAGTDYITFDRINLSESSSNTTSTTEMEWGYAVLKGSATNGSRFVTVRNCKIYMNKANSSTYGIYSANHLTTSTTALTITDTNGLNSYCRYYSDSIVNSYNGIGVFGYNAPSPYTLYDQSNRIGADGGNVIGKFGGGTVNCSGIYTSGQNKLNLANNLISSDTGTKAIVYGLQTTIANNSTAFISNNTITLSCSATNQGIYGIYNSMGDNGKININGNVIQNCSYTVSVIGYLVGINNIATADTLNIFNNSISGNILSGTGDICGIRNTGNGNMNIYANKIYNNQKTGSGGNLYCVYTNTSSSTNQIKFYSNRIYTNSQAGGSNNIYGYYSTGTAASEMIYYNKISDLTHSGTGNIVGVYSDLTLTSTKSIFSDTLYNLNTSGGYVVGINQYNSKDIRIYKNYFYGFSTSGNSGTIRGIIIQSGSKAYLYNNIITDLNAIHSTNTDAVIGITFSGENGFIYFNTIYLNCASTSSTTFGTYVIYVVTTSFIELRNNIFINKSLSGPTGGKTAVYVRSTTSLTNYSSLSDNNCYYAGVPSFRNVIYYDLTNYDSTIYQYKARVAYRDNFSFTENPPFMNVLSTPFNLHLNSSTATRCESGGYTVTTPISITDDIDGNTRNIYYPDLGADEGNFTLNDNNPPYISFVPLSYTTSLLSRAMTATIADPSGVPKTGSGRPVLYWKKRINGSYNPATGNYSGNNQYNFTFGAGVVPGDTVYYYIVAQDSASTPNIVANPFAGASGYSANPPAVSTTPLVLYSYLVLQTFSSGNYRIGGTGTMPSSGCTYVDITAAYNSLKSKLINGPINFILTSSYSASEEDSFPVYINYVYGTSSLNTITIKPDSAVTTSITTNSLKSVIRLNGAKYTIIDGSNNGTSSQNLTISNTNTSATNVAGIWFSSTGAGFGASNNVIKNCIISMGNKVNITMGIYQGGSSVSQSGSDAGDDSNLIMNNIIRKCYYGIYINGTTSIPVKYLVIKNNYLGDNNSLNYCGRDGMTLSNIDNSLISQNEINGISTTTFEAYGIFIGVGAVNSIFERNKIYNLTADKGYNACGFFVNPQTTANITFSNNILYQIIANGRSVGFYFLSASNINLYYNSVYLSGNRDLISSTTASQFSAALYMSTAGGPGFDIRNNSFANTQTAPAQGSPSNAVSIYYPDNCTILDYNNYFVSGSQGVLAAYWQGGVSTILSWRSATGKDLHTGSSDPKYTSTSNLVPLPGSYLDNHGTYISTVLIDYYGVIRSTTTPAIGAYEDVNDTSGPTITYTPLLDYYSINSRILTATITDVHGVPKTGLGLPRLYWKLNYNGSYYTSVGTYIGSNQYNFSVGNTSGNIGDTIYYYIAAQDSFRYPNTSVFPSTGASGFTINPPAANKPPSSPSFYRLLGYMAGGNYRVGGHDTTRCTTCQFVDLTAAFSYINCRKVNGPITLILTSYYNSYEEISFPVIINSYIGASDSNRITIKPDTSINKSITGSSASSILKLNGADYITIDGSNNGTNSRNLTVENTSTSSNTRSIWICSLGVNQGCHNVTIKNCNIKSGANNAYTDAIYAGNVSGNEGNDNDYLTIQNNYLTKAHNGVKILGSSTGLSNHIIIEDNLIGDTISAGYITYYGILIHNTRNCIIQRNIIRNIKNASSNAAGIMADIGVDSTSILQNSISGVSYNGTNYYGGKGIDLFSSANNLIIANNLIYDISGVGSGTISSDNIISGIRISSGSHHIKIYHNSVNLFGNLNNPASDKSAAIYVGTPTANIDIRNNTFSNSLYNTTGTSTAYSIYSDVGSTAYSFIDYNNYYSSGTQGVLGYLSANKTTLSAWQAGTVKDSNSLSANPLFISSTNLIPASGSLNRTAKYISLVPIDYTGLSRSITTPDIGAYEYRPKPIVTTGTKNSVTSSGAAIFGTVNPNNEDTSFSYLEYGTSLSYGIHFNASPLALTGNTAQSVSGVINGLIPNCLYHYRCYANNAAGTGYGADSTFRTLAIQPLATTLKPSNITAASARLNGRVNAQNSQTTVTFNYGLTISYGSSVNAIPYNVNGMSDSNVIANISGLLPNTFYHFRVNATNIAGTVNGYDSLFKTLKLPPLVSTTNPSAIQKYSAILNGKALANNDSSKCWFEYGTSASYGSVCIPVQNKFNGYNYFYPSCIISNLVPNCYYHYRLVAYNSANTVFGSDVIFKTNPSLPVVVTDSASSITSSSVYLYGTINAENSATVIGFEYGLTTSYGYIVFADPDSITGYNNSLVKAYISQLNPNSNYHFRAFGVNQQGLVYGNDLIFKTKKHLPSAVTNAAISITATSAVLKGAVNASNDSTYVSFEYGNTMSYGSSAIGSPSLVTGLTNTAVSYSLSGLIFKSTYHYRVIATNSAGTVYGSDKIFVTLPVLPFVITNAASSIASDSAVLHATINPRNSVTSVKFDFGTTTSYGISYSPVNNLLNDTINIPISLTIKNLLPNTVYHFRAVAENIAGKVFGRDTFFTSATLLPEAYTFPASSITISSADLNAKVKANNLITTIYFEYGKTIAYGDTLNIIPSAITGTVLIPVNREKSGLLPNSTIHYRIVAKNSKYTVYGSDQYFTTLSVLPVAITDDPVNITTNSGVLKGTVNAGNSLSNVFFEYGKTTSYGIVFPANIPTIDSIIDYSVSFNLNNLRHSTLIHYRVKITSMTGNVSGSDKILMTKDSLPAITTLQVTGIREKEAHCGGNITDDGGSMIISRGICWDTQPNPDITLLTKTNEPPGNGLFISDMTNLDYLKKYYIRAYAENSTGLVYGNEVFFTSLPSGIDDNNLVNNDFIKIYSYEKTAVIKFISKVPLHGIIEIYNLYGQEIVKALSDKPVNYISLDSSPSGWYIVRVITENKIFSGKIIIK